MSIELKYMSDDYCSAIDPAIAAISRFETVRERFEAVLDEKDAAESALRSLETEPGTPAHAQARAALWLPDLDAREDVLGRAHELCLSVALSTVPQTPAGLVALAALVQHQQQQGAPAAMLGHGADSILAALACAGRNGALTAHPYCR